MPFAAVLATAALLSGLAQAAAPVTVPADSIAGFAEQARLATRGLMLAIAHAGTRLVAVGDRGIILLSDDSGATWTQASSVPTQALLTGVCFIDARRGIAVGHDEVILTTQDAGVTWTRTHYAPEAQQPLLDVWCGPADAQATAGDGTPAPGGGPALGRAMAVGAYSVYFSSDDGGATWKESKFQAQPLPRKDPTGAFNRAGQAGSPTAAPGERPRSPGQPVDSAESSRSAASASSGTPPKDTSTDELNGGFHLNRVVSASASRFFIAAEAGHVYRSDDGGATWVELPSPYQGSLFGVLPLGGDALLAFGLRGNLYRSDDAGLTWQRVETGTVAMLDNATRLSDGSIVVVGLSGVVLVSRDGGKSFVLLQQDDRKGLSAVAAAGDARVLAAGEGGVKLIQLTTPVARGALSVVGSAPLKAAANGSSRGAR